MVKIVKYCKCGKYKPKSTKGVINRNCANCGGVKRQIRIGEYKMKRNKTNN